jgi:hypothetical protein
MILILDQDHRSFFPKKSPFWGSKFQNRQKVNFWNYLSRTFLTSIQTKNVTSMVVFVFYFLFDKKCLLANLTNFDGKKLTLNFFYIWFSVNSFVSLKLKLTNRNCVASSNLPKIKTKQISAPSAVLRREQLQNNVNTITITTLNVS